MAARARPRVRSATPPAAAGRAAAAAAQTPPPARPAAPSPASRARGCPCMRHGRWQHAALPVKASPASHALRCHRRHHHRCRGHQTCAAHRAPPPLRQALHRTARGAHRAGAPPAHNTRQRPTPVPALGPRGVPTPAARPPLPMCRATAMTARKQGAERAAMTQRLCRRASSSVGCRRRRRRCRCRRRGTDAQSRRGRRPLRASMASRQGLPARPAPARAAVRSTPEVCHTGGIARCARRRHRRRCVGRRQRLAPPMLTVHAWHGGAAHAPAAMCRRCRRRRCC
eukprot:349673-Chlamydomonas_euryale.AAC.2